MGPPGGRSTGRPSPPPPRGGTSAPTAGARRKGARRRHGESQEGVPQAAAWNESREAVARHPPPPRPPTGPPAAGAPAPTPRGRRDGPPPPERGAGVRPAPPPQPPAQMGAAKNKWAHACAPGRRADRAQRSRVGVNRNGMGGHAPHGQHDTSDARFVAYPGKAARHLPREGVRRQQARGETCCPATR